MRRARGEACRGFESGDTTAAGTVAEVIAGTTELSSFADVIDRAELTDALSTGDSLTVFAPTDAAFAAIPANVLASVLDDPDLVAAIAGYHVVAAGADLAGRDAVAAECAEVTADNGTIIVIDAVLMPPAGDSSVRFVVDSW